MARGPAGALRDSVVARLLLDTRSGGGGGAGGVSSLQAHSPATVSSCPVIMMASRGCSTSCSSSYHGNVDVVHRAAFRKSHPTPVIDLSPANNADQTVGYHVMNFLRAQHVVYILTVLILSWCLSATTRYRSKPR